MKKKIAVFGGTGIVGTGIVNLLSEEYEVISVGRSRGEFQVDLFKPESIREFFETHKGLDGIISTVGEGKMASLNELTAEDYRFAFESKLIANVNLMQEALKHLNPNGFIIFTSGMASIQPLPTGTVLSIACAAIEALVSASTVEDTKGIRFNAVRPAFVKETMELFGMDSSTGISARDTALVYQHLIKEGGPGEIISVGEYLGR